jgi:hypothetical protein
MSQLLLCALHRRGKPSTAGDIHETALGLAMNAGWPRSEWPTNPKQVAALLKGMIKAGDVMQVDCSRENGRDVPMFQPICGAGFDSEYEMPDPPAKPKKSDLDGMTKPQIYALVDVLEALVHEGARQRRELGSLLVRQLEEFERTTERAKRQLLAAGIEGKL